MNAFLSFMTRDTTVFNLTVHNWIAALCIFVALWIAAVARKDI